MSKLLFIAYLGLQSYNLTCEFVGNGVLRCENKEVVCYIKAQQLSCNFK